MSTMEPHLLLHAGFNRHFQDVPIAPQAQVKIAEKSMSISNKKVVLKWCEKQQVEAGPETAF